MNVQDFLTSALKEALHPVYLDIRDESFMHSVPDGAQSHFKVTVVSVGQSIRIRFIGCACNNLTLYIFICQLVSLLSLFICL